MAERAGFLACSRCSPGRGAETVAESCARVVIDYIESHLSQRVTLSMLSRRTGLSPNYVHEAFSRIVGITPKRYHETRRIDAFKALIQKGESIASSLYSTGFGSSRALYESARKVMGMTPAAFQRGGDLRIRFAIVKRGKGLVLVAGTRAGPCAVLTGGSRTRLLRELRREFPRADLTLESPPPARWTTAVRSSSREDPFVSTFPGAIRDRIYRARVLSAQRPR